MKKYRIYRDIRKKAVIFGLSLPLFALQIMIITGSLLVIIFSFSLVAILGLLILNILLYAVLFKFSMHSQRFSLTRAFPRIIMNKRSGGLYYED